MSGMPKSKLQYDKLDSINIVREKLKEYNIECEFISGKGYLINGEELEKRKVFMYYISSIYGLISDGMLDYLQDEDVKRHIEVLHKIEEELEVHYNKGIIAKTCTDASL